LTPDPNSSAALDFTVQVESLYAALLRLANPEQPNPEQPDLGGKLFYAGELVPGCRALLVAANIAGAASLAASADVAAQKQAIRDGVADFLVNSLDEALRILKNEIRKRETVAVCIASAPQAVEQEMLDRGVLPDLIPPIEPGLRAPCEALLCWRVASAPAQWLPKVDSIALNCLKDNGGFDSGRARRWLRQAPRYLGRLAQGSRILRCESKVAQEIVTRVRGAVERGEIAVEVETRLLP
jgi:hypothetical protein